MTAFARLLMFWLLLATAGVVGASPLMLDHGREELVGHVSVLIDTSKSLKFADIADPNRLERFTYIKNDLNAGLLDANVWLRFELQRAPGRPAEWWLELQPNMIEYAVLYTPDIDGHYTASRSGSSVPFSQRDLRYRNPVFKLQVWRNQPQVFFLKVKTRSSLAPRLTVWQPGEFLGAVSLEQNAFGLYLGVCTMLMLASFWFELALRDGVYRSFGVYVLSCILLTLGDTGLLYQYVFPEQPMWARYGLGLITALCICACIEFLFRFLNMPIRYPRLTRWYLGAVRLLSLAIVASVFMIGYAETMRELSLLLTFILAPLTFAILLKPAVDSTSEIRYAFLITGALMFVGLMVQFLLRLGYVERNWITEYSAYIASLCFFLIVYYAISRRYYTMRAAKQAAQRQLLEVSRQTGIELERQVAARTEDLQRAMTVVEQALSHERAAYEEQRQFIATVSHELRTPLAVIDATAQNLTRDLPETASKALARVEKIHQAAARLSSLFDTYLSSNRLDILSHGAKPAHIALRPLLEDAINAAKPLADRHRFFLDDSDMPAQIWSDPDLLRLVLRTLADNAVKYTPPGTMVWLRAATNETGCLIEVADNGPGIPENERTHIFERYFRGNNASGKSGTGLGLALARRLVETLGGSLTLEAQNGPGASFLIRLPPEPRDSTAKLV